MQSFKNTLKLSHKISLKGLRGVSYSQDQKGQITHHYWSRNSKFQKRREQNPRFHKPLLTPKSKWSTDRGIGYLKFMRPWRRKKRWYRDIRKKFFKWQLKRLNKRLIRRTWLYKTIKWRWLKSVSHISRYLKKYALKKKSSVTRRRLVKYGRFPSRWNAWLLRAAGLLFSKRMDLFFAYGIKRTRISWKRYRHRSRKFNFRIYRAIKIKFKKRKKWKWSRLYNRYFKRIYGRWRLRKIYLSKLIFKKHTQKTKYKRLIGIRHNPISLLLPVRLIPYWKRAQRLLWNKQIYVNNKPASWKTKVNKFDIISMGTRTVYFRHKSGYIRKKRRRKS